MWQKINRVKSIHLKKQSNDEGDLRFGTVISSYFEAEIYKSSSTIPISVGDKIMVYQRHDYNEAFEPIDTPQSEDVGQFVVSDVFDVSRSVYRFIAYDCLNDLDVDFSARLKELNDNGSFPMLMKDLLDEVASFSGVPYFFDPTWETNPPFAFRLTIGSFYSDNITCRDVISWFAELLGTYVYARYDNQQIIWGYYGNSRRTHFYADYHYIVTPTDQGTYYDPDRQIDLIPVFYKEDGLSVANYVTEQVDCVRLLASDGTVLGQYPSNITNPTNCYYVSGNPLLDASRNYSDPNLYLFIATTLKNNTALGNTGFINYKPGEVKFFTFRFPYDVGNSMLVEPTSGVRYRIPVMSVDITDSEIVVNAFGNKKYTTIPGAYNSTEQVATAMDIRLNNLEENGGSGITVDDSLSTVSENPVQNKVITDALDGKVSKSGDIINGGVLFVRNSGGSSAHQGRIVLNNPNITFEESHTETVMGEVLFADSATNLFKASVYGNYTAANTCQIVMRARNWVDGEAVLNTLALSVQANGTLGVDVTSPQAWRNAIEAVNIAGDKMTGNLTMEGTTSTPRSVIFVDKHITVGTHPSSDTYGGAIRLRDKNSVEIGVLQNVYRTNGTVATQLATKLTVSGSLKQNILQLRVTESGANEIYITSAPAWRKALGLGNSSGAFPLTVAQGGTGHTNTFTTNTISDIAVAASGCTITEAHYAQFGKIAMVLMRVKKTTAVSGNVNTNIATMVAGKRPPFIAVATSGSNHTRTAFMTEAGTCTVNGSISANESVTFMATYILAP